jgi:phage baseplate assembly protein W
MTANQYLDYPYRIGTGGRTASVGRAAHVRDLIEQVLFTSPGERVNRPAFGSGLLQLVFAPQSDELVSTTRFLIQGALQQTLGHLVDVEAVDVDSLPDEGVLQVTVRYSDRLDQQQEVAVFRTPTP